MADEQLSPDVEALLTSFRESQERIELNAIRMGYLAGILDACSHPDTPKEVEGKLIDQIEMRVLEIRQAAIDHASKKQQQQDDSSA